MAWAFLIIHYIVFSIQCATKETLLHHNFSANNLKERAYDITHSVQRERTVAEPLVKRDATDASYHD